MDAASALSKDISVDRRGVACQPDDIISISPKCPNHNKLAAELSQPTYSINGVGKMVINKKPDGMKSPNLADAVMIHYAQVDRQPLQFSEQTLKRVLAMPKTRGRYRSLCCRPFWIKNQVASRKPSRSRPCSM